MRGDREAAVLKTIDLAPEHLAVVKDILGMHVPGRRVVAFGSRVTGTAKPYSDLDLCVMGDAPLGLGLMADLRNAFAGSPLPFRVDIVEWAAAEMGV